MTPHQWLRTREAYNSTDGLLSAIFSWLTPYPWYVDCVLLFAMAWCVVWITKRSEVSDLGKAQR